MKLFLAIALVNAVMILTRLECVHFRFGLFFFFKLAHFGWDGTKIFQVSVVHWFYCRLTVYTVNIAICSACNYWFECTSTSKSSYVGTQMPRWWYSEMGPWRVTGLWGFCPPERYQCPLTKTVGRDFSPLDLSVFFHMRMLQNKSPLTQKLSSDPEPAALIWGFASL